MSNLMEKSTALYEELPLFQEKIQQLAAIMKVNLTDYQIDHLALRANTEEKAKNWLTELLKCGRILSDNIVNGRPIYLIELDEPVDFIGQPVDVIELPFPKNKQYPQETWEHIEIVMPFLPHESVEDWVNRICNTFLWKELTQLTMKVSEPKVEGVYGVEIIPEAIEDARQNAALNGITNAEFYVGAAEEVLPAWYEAHPDECIDVVCVDPPRKGCDEKALNTIVQMAPEKLVYVSCDSATLARDVKYLRAAGYELRHVRPVDNFPETVHVETVALLTKK